MLGLSNNCSNVTEHNFHDQGSLVFDGVDDYIDIDNMAAVFATAFTAGDQNEVNMTISAWVKLETMSSSGMIFNTRVGSGSTDTIHLFWHGSGNNLRFVTKYNNTAKTAEDDGDGSYVASGAAENDGLWWHVVGTTAHEGDTALWINGVKRGHETLNTSKLLTGTLSQANIGSNTAEGANFNGNINDLAIWKRELSEAEILTLYRNKNVDYTAIQGADLMVYYRFEEKSGTIATNDADTSKNGTITNGATYSTNIQYR